GLMRHHDIDPHHFLHSTHDAPALARLVSREAGLRHALKRLPGRRILFSNSPLHYAQAVLGALGIADQFDALYCMEQTRFRPKPDPAGFRIILRREKLVPARTFMVEDVLDNLVAARRLGLKTVWISREPRRPAWVDIKATSVLQ